MELTASPRMPIRSQADGYKPSGERSLHLSAVCPDMGNAGNSGMVGGSTVGRIESPCVQSGFSRQTEPRARSRDTEKDSWWGTSSRSCRGWVPLSPTTVCRLQAGPPGKLVMWLIPGLEFPFNVFQIFSSCAEFWALFKKIFSNCFLAFWRRPGAVKSFSSFPILSLNTSNTYSKYVCD